MKTWLLFFFLLCSNFTYADELINIKQAHEYCSSIEKLAGTIMDSRQAGVPMKRMMDVILKEFDNEGQRKADEVTAFLIEMAYDEPRYHSEKVANAAIKDFQNRIYSLCLKERKK